MIQPILLPKLGETMTEAAVEKWRKAEGDPIRRGDVILEITTDKATLEVESSIVGVLKKILAPEKVTLPVNTVIALAGDPGDALPDNLEELLAAARGEKPAPAPAGAGANAASNATAAAADAEGAVAAPSGRMLISPRARTQAREARVPLEVLRGSGPGGRVVEADVLAYLERRAAARATPVAIELAYERGIDLTALHGTGPAGRITKEDVLAAKPVLAQPPRPRCPPRAKNVSNSRRCAGSSRSAWPNRSARRRTST